MSQNSNAVLLFLPLDLRVLINRECGKGDQLPATVILKILTEHFKDDLPIEVYDSLTYNYSLSALEQRKRKSQRKEDVEDGLEKAHKRKERKLLDEIADCEMRLRKKDLSPKVKEVFESRLAEAKANLELEKEK